MTLVERAKEARRLVWRDAALDAATHLFARDGFHGTAMGDVARASGVSLRALYTVFPSKDDLFLAVIDDAFGHLAPVLGGATDVLALIEDFLALADEHRSVSLLYARSGHGAPVRLADGRDPFESYRVTIAERLTELVEDRYEGPARAAILAQSILATLIAAAVAALTADENTRLLDLAPDIQAIYRPLLA